MMRPSLSGQSGANLRVLSSHGHAIVRKSAATVEGNPRLQVQMEKQQAFLNLCTSVRAPEIVDSGTNEDGTFFFDMRYVPGLDGHRHLESCTPAQLRDFGAALSDHLSEIRNLPEISQSTRYPSLYDANLAKLTEIHEKNVGLPDALAGRILRALGPLKAFGAERPGFCHGDFTLENMIVDSAGQLYFVDFLDSTFEHPVQDFVKLFQDVHGGWFKLRGRRISGSFILHLDGIIRRSAESALPGFESVRPVLLALNFCRILPYVPEGPQKQFVIERIQRFIHQSP